eukprot:5823130-Pyramimonas_sp.AAC.1
MREQRAYGSPSPLLRIPGSHVWRVWVDPLHALDLGVYQIVVASRLRELVLEGTWAGNSRSE